MKGILSYLLDPTVIFIAGILIAIIIALILFGLNSDNFINLFSGFAPK